jgi:hypothetical protein
VSPSIPQNQTSSNPRQSSSITTWNNNQRKNGWTPPDPHDNDVVESIADNGVGAPGIFNIPICSGAEMFKVITDQNATPDNHKYWPCPNP